MALARLDVPGLVLYGGSIAPGHVDGRDVTIQDVFEAIGANAAGRLDAAGLRRIEDGACPGAGACGGQFTANTMAAVCEFLGISPMGSASVPAVDPAKADVAAEAGRLAMALHNGSVNAARRSSRATRSRTRSPSSPRRADRPTPCCTCWRSRKEAGVDLDLDGLRRGQPARAAHRRSQAGRPVRRDRSAPRRRHAARRAAARRRPACCT